VVIEPVELLVGEFVEYLHLGRLLVLRRLSSRDEPAAALTTGREETEEPLRPRAPALALDPLVEGQPLCSVCA
jgi:hypothetical protein